MLVKKQKHQYMLRDPSSSETTIESIRNWVRKIEQTTQSISSRLAAVEKRFSRQTLESVENPVTDIDLERSFEQIFSTSRTEKNQKQLRKVSRVLEQEFSSIQATLHSQNQEILTLKEQLAVFHQLINDVTQKIQQVQQQESHIVEEMTSRMQHLEHRVPRVMKLGSFEVPFEVTGVIGGILAFIIAFLVGTKQNAVVLSPWFLVVVGFILLGSAMIKTVHCDSTGVKPWRTRRSETVEPIEK